jgi:hypothetical protein
VGRASVFHRLESQCHEGSLPSPYTPSHPINGSTGILPVPTGWKPVLPLLYQVAVKTVTCKERSRRGGVSPPGIGDATSFGQVTPPLTV